MPFSKTITQIEGWNDDNLHMANYDASDRPWSSKQYVDIDPKWAVLHHTGCRNGPCSDGYDSSEAYAEHWRDTGKGVHFLVDEKGKFKNYLKNENLYGNYKVILKKSEINAKLVKNY